MPITAFISDAVITEDTCLGVSFNHSKRDDAYRPVDGAILQTGKIQRSWKERGFWLLETSDGNYVIGSFMRDVGRGSFLELLRSGERL
ncbi:hypothetical protein D3C86_2100890 [compost metagenome]